MQFSKSAVIKSLLWKFLERGGLQIVQFIISIIVARILDPDDYGVMTIITVFTTIATVFVQSGLGTALVQKKDADEVDFSSVLYYSLAIAGLTYILLFFSAPLIAQFYKMPELIPLLRVMSLVLFPGALVTVQNASIAREMQFKKQFFSSMAAVFISGVLGIVLAFLNYGAWALVYQQISYQICTCIVLLFIIKWKPVLKFSYKKTIGLLKYGMRLLGARLIDTIYHNIENLVIGKKYSSATLAFFSKGKQFPLIMIDNIDGSIQSVMLPTFSSRQENIIEVKNLVRRTISLSTFLVFPVMAGLAAIGSPLISILLGEKWIFCVPFLQIYCLITALFPLQTANLQAINAIGRSDVYLRLMTIKRLIGIAILSIAVFCFKSVYAIAFSCLIIEIISIVINIKPNKNLLGYTFREQMIDIVPNFLTSLLMGTIVYCITFIKLQSFITMLFQIIAGIAIYILTSKLFRLSNFSYLCDIFKSYISKTTDVKKSSAILRG